MKTRKFTALLLVLCLLLTAVPYSAPVRAAEEEHLAQEQTQTQTETQEQTQVTSETAAETTTAPLAEGIFFQFVDQAVFQANGHVARVPEEETLSTYVFRNSDGTKTVYYLPDNVKFIAEDGTMVDKDLTLVSQSGGYGVKRSDIQYLLPTSAASGIRMEHGNKQVTMYPQASLGRATAATVSGDSVRYANYFGSGIHLVYTPIPSGLKEDIVLDSYTGTSSFSFTIDTNGMRLYNDEGQYYFAASADAEEKIYLGDIIVYDAKGEPSAGTLTVTPVTMGQQYTLTVSADPAFLTAPDTVYPVTIDPTLTVSAATNSSFIEDVSLYQNAPNANTGNWTYNHCGYYASANTDYGVCRTAFRLTGLKNDSTWQSISYSNIVSAKFYIKEATGTAGVRLLLQNITNTTWTESTATWNNLANAYDPVVSAEASPAYGGWAEFNFTNLAKDWKNSLMTADCSFMLISTNNTVDKAFYSAEFGTTSYRPYVVITYNYDTVLPDAEEIDVGTSASVSVFTAGATTIFKFVPAHTGFYTFESSNIASGDPKAWLYNSNFEQITASDDVNGLNFRLTYHLVAGSTYYFAAGCYGSIIGSYSVQLFNTLVPSYIGTSNIFSGTSANISFTTSSKVIVYKFTPTQSAEYLLYTVNTIGDPQIWLYDSSVGLLTSNDNGAGIYDARIVCSLVAGHTYYIVAGEHGSQTGAYKLNLLKAASASGATYYLKNIGTLKYMDIKGPVAQEFVHQWTFHTGSQEKWTVQRQSDGYYTIRSKYGNKYYVGVADASTGTNNIKLYSSISNSTKWKIFEFGSDYVVLEPKTAPGKLLCAPSAGTGVELQLSLMGASMPSTNQWRLLNIGTYFAQVRNYFDDGYSVYYNETNSLSSSSISSYMDEIADRYYDILGLTLIYDDAAYYESPIDMCKGTVTSSNINTLCAHGGTIHTERNNVISSFKSSFSGSNTATNVLWSCHAITSTATNGDTNYNRSCSSGDAVIMIERSDSDNRSRNAKGVLMHELNHQYGAVDHYHELADKNDPNSCKFKSICSECGTNPRPSTCIMYQSRIDISDSNVICTSCKNDILSQTSLFNTTEVF